MSNIQVGPHFEVASAEFAKWLEEQAADCWWNVDGDRLLPSRLSFPCPSDELASELRKINRPLLIQAKGKPDAEGQVIDVTRIGELAHFESSSSPGPQGPWVDDRFFPLCWKGSSQDWFLIEDSVTAKQYQEDARSTAK